jgi:hypothetical protein
LSATGLSPALAPGSTRLRLTYRLIWSSADDRAHSFNPTGATAAALARQWFGLIPVRSPLLRDCFLFLGVREMVQFPRCPPRPARYLPKQVGCPIRRSWDQGLLAAPPRVSSPSHVLHRHAAPRHPPYAHSVFPAGRPGDDSTTRISSRHPHIDYDHQPRLERYTGGFDGTHQGPTPLNRDHGRCGEKGGSELPRKEVIQPHLPVRLPCYDFVPVAAPALGRCLGLPR